MMTTGLFSTFLMLLVLSLLVLSLLLGVRIEEGVAPSVPPP
jgi:hypothetical protein